MDGKRDRRRMGVTTKEMGDGTGSEGDGKTGDFRGRGRGGVGK
jgi:hypothetical protein